MSCDKKENKHLLNNSIISSVDSVTLLGIEIDNKLNFEKHVPTICRNANRQLNAISRIPRYIGAKEQEIIVNTFVYSHFMHCPLA